MSEQPIKVRIAPSPTGDPHVGTAYVALFNYVMAKKYGGSFILRIEDTDQTRAKSSSDISIMTCLKWLGLQWDEGPDIGGPNGPYRQSERLEIYQEHVKQLVDNGGAYRCFCTRERLDELRAQQRAEKLPTQYDGFCKSLSADAVQKNLADGVAHVVRLKMPETGSTVFNEELRGDVEIENERIDDQVLLKSDGFPTYHLANVVDDQLMGVTHVIRAEEWISSTPKHVQLYKAFGWNEPKWIHLPLLRNVDKSKISKRKNPVSLDYYRRAGILPEALLNFLALMGWNPGNDVEVFNVDEMTEKFEYKDINLGDPVFDVVKLNWMNQQYIQKLDTDRFVEIMRDEYFSKEKLAELKPLMIERLNRFEEFFDKASFFFNGALNYDGLAIIPKGKEAKDMRKAMKGLVEKLDDLYDWDVEHLKTLLNEHLAELDWKAKEYFMPLRLICTGRKDSPPLHETLVALGREVVRFRIRDAINTALKP